MATGGRSAIHRGRGTTEFARLAVLQDGLAKKFQRRLLAWFRRNCRDLPWRRRSDPYSVWISEVMLQQTQVEKVVDYYQRFLERFPNVEALAAAPLEEVLRAWEGLGYYRRAVNLWKAAQVIVKDYGGCLPADKTLLQQLPGIGRYTAGAILSIGFGKPAPILEANSRRVLARFFGLSGTTIAQARDADLWTFAEQLVPKRNAGQFNQALMELGALICLPKRPRCLACPLRSSCRAYQTGEFTTASKGNVRSERQSVVVAVLICDNKLLLRQNAPGERWAHLWDFPRLVIPTEPMAPRKILENFSKSLGLKLRSMTLLGSLVHFVTRFRIDAEVYVGTVWPGEQRAGSNQGQNCLGSTGLPKTGDSANSLSHAGDKQGRAATANDHSPQEELHIPSGGNPADAARWRWVPVGELEALPLPAPSRRIARMALEFLSGAHLPQKAEEPERRTQTKPASPRTKTRPSRK